MSTPSRWYVCDSRMCVSACAFPSRWYACVYMCVCVRVCACRLCVCVFACCFCSRTCGFCSFSSTSTLSSRTYHVCMCVYVCVHVCVAYKHVFVHVHTERERDTHTHGHTHTHTICTTGLHVRGVLAVGVSRGALNALSQQPRPGIHTHTQNK